eukprot:gene194-203_t
MAGGRSPEERQLSKRQMFLKVRDAFNEAAKAPGFFETGDRPVEVELYCKSNRDGKQIGDCPFSQFVQLVLLKKGVEYVVKPTLPSKKPDWLINKHNGALPTIHHRTKDITISDSLKIAEYIEEQYPLSSLTRQGALSYQEALEKISNFFPTLSNYIKNKDDTKDPILLAAVEKELDNIDEILRSTPGRYLCGIDITIADLYITPQLFHALVAMDHFKKVDILNFNTDPIRPALEKFMLDMFNSKEFNNKKCYYNVDQVVYGWKVARGESPAPV